MPPTLLFLQFEKESMAAVFRVHREIFVIEVQNQLFRLETKLLIQHHGGVACRHVQRHVLAHASLKPVGKNESNSYTKGLQKC